MNAKSLLAGCIAAAFATSSIAAVPSAADPAPAETAQNQAAPAAQPAAIPDDQEIKCRRVAVTGSLIKKGKVCKTVAEWSRLDQHGNQRARDIVEDNRSGMASN
jgi:hypothetical protein